MSYLFGSILAVPRADLWLMLALDLIIVAVVALFFKELLVISFDEAFAEISNIPVERLYMLLISLIALTVVMMMRVVGLIMVIAMLTIPAAIAAQFTRDLKWMMGIAIALGAVFTLVGLWLSYALDLTSGATIILVAGSTYLLSLLLRRIRRRETAHGQELTITRV